MSISAKTLRLLVEAGLSGEAIVQIAESMEEDCVSRPRSSGAERQARYRQRKAEEQAESVTCDVTRDVTSDVTGVTKEVSPHTPLQENNTPPKKTPKGVQKPPPVDEIWQAWPLPGRRRSSVKQVRAEYARVLKAHDHADVMRAVGLYLRSPDATKDGGAFVPALHRWLKDERFTAWLDAAQPAPVSVEPVDLPDTPEGRFLAKARELGVSEIKLRSWLGRFAVERIGAVSACVAGSRENEFKEVFAGALEAEGLTFYPESYAAKRRAA